MNFVLVVVNKAVWAGKYEPGMPVVRPSNQERRPAIVSVNFEDLPVPIRFVAGSCFHDKTVSDYCAHRCLLLSHELNRFCNYMFARGGSGSLGPLVPLRMVTLTFSRARPPWISSAMDVRCERAHVAGLYGAGVTGVQIRRRVPYCGAAVGTDTAALTFVMVCLRRKTECSPA